MIARTLHLTQGFSNVLEHQIRTTYPGQAHFANTGPFGATCADCVFLGYRRQVRNANGDVKAVYRNGWVKFYELTNKHGPVVPGHAAACRYFEPKEKASK